MSVNVDKTARCETCGRFIEHYAGVQGSVWNTAFWRHRTATDHPAVPAEGSVVEVPR